MSPDHANAIHPQSRTVVLDTLTGHRFSRRVASVNSYPKITFFNEVSLFSAGFTPEYYFCSFLFPLSFPPTLFSTWVDHRSKWVWRELNNTATGRIIKRLCCLLQVLFCVYKILCVNMFPGASHTEPVGGNPKGLVPYQAFASPELGWPWLNAAYQPTIQAGREEVSSSDMSSRLSRSTAPLEESKSSATFLLGCFLVILSCPSSAPGAGWAQCFWKPHSSWMPLNGLFTR